MTEKYPDVCRLMLTLLIRPVPSSPSAFPAEVTTPSATLLDLLHTQSVTSLIIDAEVVAVDKDTGAYRTFQDLSNRAKKDVQVEDIKVVVGIFAFDLMLLNDDVSQYPHHGVYLISLATSRLSLLTSSTPPSDSLSTFL